MQQAETGADRAVAVGASMPSHTKNHTAETVHTKSFGAAACASSRELLGSPVAS